MAFCINCGQELIDGAKFCANCGAKVNGDNEIKAKTVIIASSNPWHDSLGLYFSKEQAYRSYLTLSKLNKPIAKGMYINVEKPSKTIRVYH